ncbi:MAG TPA: TerB family tellurite resistance protein [Bacteroidales bacterium]|nr:TerB family tellurite resistance protein [Bacteroidales bacterium]HPT22703.1 TerB family tellurite resistance protein [Bacteroidales bacterium]
MGFLGKFLGAGFGWTFGGPIGALLGLLVGSMIDSTTEQTSATTTGRVRTTQGDFGVSLIVLLAAVMKADGKVVKSELDYVKAFFVQQFGRESAKQALLMLKDILKQEILVRDICLQIRQNMDYSSRLQLLHLLFNVSVADGKIQPAEIELLEKISTAMGVATNDFSSIKNMFIPETDSSYKILEIDQSSSNDEVKKAYRRMAMKYHPDKVSHLGDDFRKSAEEKFKKVNEAYEKIKKERNMV